MWKAGFRDGEPGAEALWGEGGGGGREGPQDRRGREQEGVWWGSCSSMRGGVGGDKRRRECIRGAAAQSGAPFAQILFAKSN